MHTCILTYFQCRERVRSFWTVKRTTKATLWRDTCPCHMYSQLRRYVHMCCKACVWMCVLDTCCENYVWWEMGHMLTLCVFQNTQVSQQVSKTRFGYLLWKLRVARNGQHAYFELRRYVRGCSKACVWVGGLYTCCEKYVWRDVGLCLMLTLSLQICTHSQLERAAPQAACWISSCLFQYVWMKTHKHTHKYIYSQLERAAPQAACQIWSCLFQYVRMNRHQKKQKHTFQAAYFSTVCANEYTQTYTNTHTYSQLERVAPQAACWISSCQVLYSCHCHAALMQQ